MPTMYSPIEGVTVLRTRVEDRDALIARAMDLVEDYCNTNEWDYVPTHEPMSTPSKPFWAQTH